MPCFAMNNQEKSPHKLFHQIFQEIPFHCLKQSIYIQKPLNEKYLVFFLFKVHKEFSLKYVLLEAY